MRAGPNKAVYPKLVAAFCFEVIESNPLLEHQDVLLNLYIPYIRFAIVAVLLSMDEPYSYSLGIDLRK
jgi:hypothetical protein